jgi:hypothetical protein
LRRRSFLLALRWSTRVCNASRKLFCPWNGLHTTHGQSAIHICRRPARQQKNNVMLKGVLARRAAKRRTCSSNFVASVDDTNWATDTRQAMSACCGQHRNRCMLQDHKSTATRTLIHDSQGSLRNQTQKWTVMQAHRRMRKQPHSRVETDHEDPSQAFSRCGLFYQGQVVYALGANRSCLCCCTFSSTCQAVAV